MIQPDIPTSPHSHNERRGALKTTANPLAAKKLVTSWARSVIKAPTFTIEYIKDVMKPYKNANTAATPAPIAIAVNTASDPLESPDNKCPAIKSRTAFVICKPGTSGMTAPMMILSSSTPRPGATKRNASNPMQTPPQKYQRSRRSATTLN